MGPGTMMDKLYLALGSNLGDRESYIRQAVRLLDVKLGRDHEAITPLMQTEAIGFDGGDFLNCIVVYRSDLSPKRILGICKEVEKELGRTDAPEYDASGKRVYHDRTIDVDILMYGSRKVETEDLVIPHPQVESRPYIKKLLLFL